MGRQPITESWLDLKRRRSVINREVLALPDEAVTVDLTHERQASDDDEIDLPTWLRRTPSIRKRPLFDRWRE